MFRDEEIDQQQKDEENLESTDNIGWEATEEIEWDNFC